MINMIGLKQNKNYLIGSEADIATLANKNHARVLVASDSHNHFDILLSILKRFGPTCDAFAFCGDGFCDIANIYALALQDDDIRQVLPPVMAFVCGNCDPSFYPISNSMEGQLHAPAKQILTVNGQNIMIVHGHRESVDYSFNTLGLEMKLSNCKTSLFGHTHIAEEVFEKDFKFINPGSCSTPRGGQPQSFAILTVEKDFIDTAFLMITSDSSDYVNGAKGDKDDKFKIWTPN